MERKTTVADLEAYKDAMGPVVQSPWGAGLGAHARPADPAPRPRPEEGGPRDAAPAGGDDLEEELERELEEMLGALPEEAAAFRLTIRHGEGVFDFPDGRAEGSIEGFLVRVEPRRARFEDSRVACLSRDGRVGRLADRKTEISCEECRRCPLSARVYMVPSDLSRELWYFDMPPAQLGSLVRYVNSVAYGEKGEGRARTHPCRVVTRVRLEKRGERRAARIAFERVRDAADEEVREARAVFRELYPLAAEGGAGAADSLSAGGAGGLDSVEF